jgi:4-hydroxybenzoate polyprenyltransferase
LQPYPSPLRRTRSFLTAMHLPSCVMIGFAVILGEAIASQILPARAVFCGFMTGFLLQGTHMVLNDSFDREIDVSSQRRGPLPDDVANPNGTLSFAIILASLGLLFAAYLGPWTLLTALLSVAMIIVYHVEVKKYGLVGNALAGTNVAIMFLYAGFAVGDLTLPLAIFAAMAFFSSMGRETMTNLANVSGDSSAGAKSEAASEGYAKVGKQSAVSFVAAVALSILPLLLGLVSSYYIPLVAICDTGFLLTAYSMMNSPTPRNAQRNRNYVLIWLSFGLLAFVIGTI